MALPRNLIEIEWFQTVATYNPVSYLIEGIRSLIVTGWDAEALALGFGVAASIAAGLADRRLVRAAHAAGAHVRSRFVDVTLAVSWRNAAQLVHAPGGAPALAPLPALLLHGLRGRALAARRRAGLRLPGGLHGLPVRLRPPPVGRVRRRLHRVRDRPRLRERLRAQAPAGRAEPRRDRGRLRARRARPLDLHRLVRHRRRAARGHGRARRRARPLRALRARRS